MRLVSLYLWLTSWRRDDGGALARALVVGPFAIGADDEGGAFTCANDSRGSACGLRWLGLLVQRTVQWGLGVGKGLDWGRCGCLGVLRWLSFRRLFPRKRGGIVFIGSGLVGVGGGLPVGSNLLKVVAVFDDDREVFTVTSFILRSGFDKRIVSSAKLICTFGLCGCGFLGGIKLGREVFDGLLCAVDLRAEVRLNRGGVGIGSGCGGTCFVKVSGDDATDEGQRARGREDPQLSEGMQFHNNSPT